jgi:hypothetical protein
MSVHPVVTYDVQADDFHLQLALSESAATEVTNWEIWAEAAERLAGHSLDGDEPSGDPYSIDSAYDAWKAGSTPRAYVESFQPTDEETDRLAAEHQARQDAEQAAWEES